MDGLPVPADDEEFTLETRKAAPGHFLTKIKCFSKLSQHGISKVESMEFAAGDYKWKLIIYPNGDNREKKVEHISVYLSMVGTDFLPPDWEVNAIFNLFLYNHISGNYLCFRGKLRSFNAVNSEWGISKLMSKTRFTEPSNGYLFHDNCVFGAEVFVIKNQRAIENVYVFPLEDPCMRKWKISDFSKLQNAWESQEFIAGGYKWNIKLYPNGDSRARGRYISIFLELVDFAAHKKVKATCLFNFRNMLLQNEKNYSKKVTHWFTSQESSCGFSQFLAIGDFGKGFLLNDCCVLETHLYLEAIQEAVNRRQ